MICLYFTVAYSSPELSVTTDFQQAIPGYSATKFPIPDELAGTEDWTDDQWRTEFAISRESLAAFFAGRDPLVVLARTALRYLTQGVRGAGNPSQVRPLEQVEVEIA